MKKYLSLAIAAVVCAAVSYFAFPRASAQQAGNSQAAERSARFAAAKDKVRSAGSVRLIVRLKADFEPEGRLPEAARERQRNNFKNAADRFENRYANLRSAEVKRFKFIPFVAVEADEALIAEIENDPEVLSVEEDELARPTLAQSTQIISAPAAWASGFTGLGQTVAILDTGIEKTHGFLAGKVIAEGCYSTTSPSGGTSLCPGGVASTTAAGSGANCAANVDGCDHGTHVAGIAAGRGTSFSGVAKDANLIAIQVFSRFDSASDCGSDPVPCVRSYSSDQIRGLERVYELSSSMNVASANLSLGGGQFSATCDAGRSSYKAAIDNLRSRNIATVVASGNDGSTTGISSPACISTAVSIGSTNDTVYQGGAVDTVSPFSNSASILTMLAPGLFITSSVPGGGFGTWGGTSMAAPHVAGAYALLRQRNPNASIQAMTDALVSAGLQVADTRNGVVKPRINVNAALAAIGTTSNPTGRRTAFDIDGDGKSDLGVFRRSVGEWRTQRSSDGVGRAFGFGASTDSISPADFTGDGKTDIAVFRPSTGFWYVMRSEDNTFYGFPFGAAGDVPVPADFDADGKADAAVFRAGTWYISLSSGGSRIESFGAASDLPVAADYDGDGKADPAVFRPSGASGAGEWWLNMSTQGVRAVSFGAAGDKAVPADYTGDGKTDVAVFRPSTGFWYILRSEDLTFYGFPFGVAGDVPSSGDYDGDGKADPAVFRSGTWYINRSAAGQTVIGFGTAGDVPVPSAFVR